MAKTWVTRGLCRDGVPGSRLMHKRPGPVSCEKPGTGPQRRSSAVARIKALVRKSRFRAAAQRSPRLSAIPWTAQNRYPCLGHTVTYVLASDPPGSVKGFIRAAQVQEPIMVVTPMCAPKPWGSSTTARRVCWCSLPDIGDTTNLPACTLRSCGSLALPKLGILFCVLLRLFRFLRYSNRAIVSSYDVVENQRRQAAVPAELSRTMVLGRGGSVSLGGFCRQLKQTVLPMRS
jgi:hypothetical protein